MKKIGGPQAVIPFLRSIGDTVFRQDRWEPKFNAAILRDPHDTSTPGAAVKSLKELLLGGGW